MHEESGAELPAIDPARGDDLSDIATIASWLRGQLPWLRLHPAAAECYDETTAIVDHIRHVVGPPDPHWYAGPCDTCGRDLYADSGGHAWIRCRCGTSYDAATRREELKAKASDRLGTVTEIARTLSTLGEPVTVDMIYGYVRRKRLVAHGTDSQDRALYRFGDVRELLAEHAGRSRAS